MNPRAERRRLLAAALAAGIAAFSYLGGLDSIFAPSIGDEAYYLQIARVTVGSGRMLPLRSEAGITDTKPPLLFWQGAVSTGFGSAWDLRRLRLPVVATSFAAAALAGLLAARISARAGVGLLATLMFLGFRSTIQQGRPFLTNAGETLFLFLPVVLLHGRTRTGWRLALACGLSLGAAALYKSFFLVVPGTVSMALVLWRRVGWDLRALARAHGAFLAGSAALGLALLCLWPLLDPRPDLVFSQFVLGENVAKFSPRGYLAGLVSGPYPIWRIWLGDLANAGLYAPAVAALLWDLWRRRREIPAAEAELWLYLLGFLAVYSLPAQRQENYLLPTCAALAVLLALRWEALPGISLRPVLGLLALAGLALPALEWAIERKLGARLFPPLSAAIPLALGAIAALAAFEVLPARRSFPLLALGALAAATAFLAPFSARFPERATAGLRGHPVLFPDRFLQAQELYRFLLPGAEIRGYRCPQGAVPCPPPPAETGAHAALLLDAGAPLPEGWTALAEIPQLKQRHDLRQIADILGGSLDLLVERLVLARRD